jgi:DNA repair exonuclease SbcCD nuclease subunit
MTFPPADGSRTVPERPRRESLKLLHASDFHIIGYGWPGDRGLRALRAMLDLSSRVAADIVVIAGDLFDHDRLGESAAVGMLGELGRVPVPVVVLPGNHDCLEPTSVYWRVGLSRLPSNVRLFTAAEGETFSFPEMGLAVWGKALYTYNGRERPMAGVPPRGEERWQVAVAHGHYAGDEADRTHGLVITRDEIERSNRDYVALGHWSVFRHVTRNPVVACYSGSASEAGSVAVVDLTDRGVHARPERLSY